MPSRDGDGWLNCTCGNRHWGLHGAAGIAIINVADGTILLQHRAHWTHGGATWALPGGARDSHEEPIETALRELEEELGVEPTAITVVREELLFDHDKWRYHTVIATISDVIDVRHNDESLSAEWVSIDLVETYELHPSFAGTWYQLRLAIIEIMTQSVTSLDLE